MGSKSDVTPLIALVGETGSGKSGLALDLAQLFSGEIIAADSRTIYKGMDIGTAKPSLEDQQRVPHHLLNVVRPDQEFTVAEFKRQANKAITAITSRGHCPFLVGGTGLYVDAVLYNFQFSSKPDTTQRLLYSSLTIPELQQRLIEQGIPLPTNERNPRHLIRALETGGVPAARSPLRTSTLVLGWSIDRETLRERMEQRVDTMFAAGLIAEVESLVDRFGWDAPGFQAPGYKTLRRLIEGKSSFEETRQQLIREHLQVAKRQRTWFRRNKDIQWICKKEEAVDLITTLLNK
jgi:tRNA dimethylallyltransferase